jgi:16S rRNA (guanine966-N2)-methyltransferase
MRVIAGEAKGRRLTGIRAGRLRPTTDRVREALFSALGEQVVGATVLDLYAGSGALGIEALSRGAASAVFVDADPTAVAAIRSNLALTKLGERATVVRTRAEAFVSTWVGERFDVVVMDPPYAQGAPVDVLSKLSAGTLLSREAVVILESRGPLEGEALGGFRITSQRRYGDSTLLFLRPEGSQ